MSGLLQTSTVTAGGHHQRAAGTRSGSFPPGGSGGAGGGGDAGPPLCMDMAAFVLDSASPLGVTGGGPEGDARARHAAAAGMQRRYVS